MAGVQEYYVDTQTGQADLPLYDRWFKWTKFAVNWTTAFLALATLVVKGTSLNARKVLLAFFVLFTLIRTAEVAKETIPIFLCGQSFAWVKACCRRKDQAREVDKLTKYLSSLILAPITAGLALGLFAIHPTVLGCLIVGLVAIADFCMGAYVVYTDEWRKDFHRVRQRPDEFELDDNMDPYDTEEELGLMGHAGGYGSSSKVAPISRQPSNAHTAQGDRPPKVQTLSEKALSLPPGLLPQKSRQIRPQESDDGAVAVLYAGEDDSGARKGGGDL